MPKMKELEQCIGFHTLTLGFNGGFAIDSILSDILHECALDESSIVKIKFRVS